MLPFWLLATALVVVGLAGLVLPGIPGASLVFIGLLLAAWAEGFAYVGLWTIIALAVLALLTYGVDFWATIFSTKTFGASKRGIIGALLGAVVGIFLGFLGVIFARLSGRRSANFRLDAVCRTPRAPAE